MPGRDSFDETVGRLAISRLFGEAKQVSEMRGLPPDVRHATPEEELALYDEWDDRVDPQAVLTERFQKHVAAGLTPDGALAEAILETAAAGFSKRLKMAQGAGRLTLTEQVRWLEQMAMKSRANKNKSQSPGEIAESDEGITDEVGGYSEFSPDAGLNSVSAQPTALNLRAE
jgi:hypothetical protein